MAKKKRCSHDFVSMTTARTACDAGLVDRETPPQAACLLVSLARRNCTPAVSAQESFPTWDTASEAWALETSTGKKAHFPEQGT